MHSEIELKLKIQPQDIGRLESYELFQKYNNGTPERHYLVSTYFDTPNLDFIRNRIALRIRKKGKQIIQTMKYDSPSQNGLSRRPEIEWSLSSPQPDLSLAKNSLPTVLQPVDSATLISVFETRFHRTSYMIDWPSSTAVTTIEVAIDQGEITAGQYSADLCELELELLKGEENAVHELHNHLKSGFKLQPCDTSKADLGYRLAIKNRPSIMANASMLPI